MCAEPFGLIGKHAKKIGPMMAGGLLGAALAKRGKKKMGEESVWRTGRYGTTTIEDGA